MTNWQVRATGSRSLLRRGPPKAGLMVGLVCLSAGVGIVEASPATGTLLAQADLSRNATTDRNTRQTLYFSDCQANAAPDCVPGNNANPGTLAAPKQDFTRINLNTLAAGTSLLFARGGAWNFTAMQRLENLNTTATAPLVFADYGTGALPLFKFASGQIAFELGGGWNNQTNDGGYAFRNIKFDGGGVTSWGFWLRDNVRDVTFDGVEITGFAIAVHSQSVPPHGVNNISVLNSRIVRNSDMGWLGKVNGVRIEGSLFEGNNFGGSGFSHAVYIGGGSNGVIRNNRFVRNSVVNGVCTGGNVTFHGQIDGMVIEGNTIEQDSANPGCYGFSITQGHATAEWFRNFVVRGNKVINVGQCAFCVQSAPSILVEGNTIINQRATPQTAIAVGSTEYGGGDVVDAGAIVRNNTICFPDPHRNSVAVRVSGAGAQTTDNATLKGREASTGVCAR